jgi:cytochrome P450
MSTITLSNWLDAKAALRNRDLRQGLYDEGIALMHGVIVNLHGAEHNARRRLENRLFRRETFAFWEKELIPHNISVSIQPHLVGGQVDLLQLARLTMMRISAGIAGIDLGDDPDRFNMLADIMAKLARASSVNHFIGDKQSVIEQGNIALELFATEFFEPARKNRLKLISEISQQAKTVDDLPKDVLTTLLVNYDNLEISDESLLHEIAYFPWVGSHSTSGAFVNMMDHIFEWISHHPNDREKLFGCCKDLASNHLGSIPRALNQVVSQSSRRHLNRVF